MALGIRVQGFTALGLLVAGILGYTVWGGSSLGRSCWSEARLLDVAGPEGQEEADRRIGGRQGRNANNPEV